MNKILITVIILVLVFVAGGVYYFSSQKTYAPIVPVNNNPVVSEPTTTQPTAQVMEVTIKNFSFEPEELQAKVGTEVKWTNQDSVSHTITADNFESELIGNGQSYSRIFNEVGVFNYHCSPHPSMTGIIIVNP